LAVHSVLPLLGLRIVKEAISIISKYMKLSIYSLKKILFQGEAKSLNCQTVMGEITVLDNHQTLITVLASGIVKIVDNKEKESFFPITSGFLEVRENNEVRCIVEE
jgi:F0F1-type ATP synthase epsilon subunit